MPTLGEENKVIKVRRTKFSLQNRALITRRLWAALGLAPFIPTTFRGNCLTIELFSRTLRPLVFQIHLLRIPCKDRLRRRVCRLLSAGITDNQII